MGISEKAEIDFDKSSKVVSSGSEITFNNSSCLSGKWEASVWQIAGVSDSHCPTIFRMIFEGRE